MALRADLVSEVDVTLDGSGNFTGDWIDSAGTKEIRLIAKGAGTPSITIELSSDESNVLGTELTASGPEVRQSAALSARYFRLKVTGGTASTAFRASIRAMA